MVVVAKAGVVKEPEVGYPPTPAEEHEVLFVEDQVMKAVVPLAIEDGDAARVTVGAGAAATVTVVLWLADPPGPVQVTV